MSDSRFQRRSLLRGALAGSAVLTGPGFLVGCAGKQVSGGPANPATALNSPPPANPGGVYLRTLTATFLLYDSAGRRRLLAVDEDALRAGLSSLFRYGVPKDLHLDIFGYTSKTLFMYFSVCLHLKP